MGGGGRRSPPPPNGGGGKFKGGSALGGGKGKGQISAFVGGGGGARGGGGALGGEVRGGGGALGGGGEKGKISGKVVVVGGGAKGGSVGGREVEVSPAIVGGVGLHSGRAPSSGKVGKMVAKDGGAGGSSLPLARTRSGKVMCTPLVDSKVYSSLDDGDEQSNSGGSPSVDVTLGTHDTREDDESIVDGEAETSSEEDDDGVHGTLPPSCSHKRLSSSSSPTLLKENALSPTLRAIFGIGSNLEVHSKLMKQSSSSPPSHGGDSRLCEVRSSPSSNVYLDGVKDNIKGGEDVDGSLENINFNVGATFIDQSNCSFSEKCSFSGLAGILGGAAAPAAPLPATMEVQRSTIAAGVEEDEGAAVQSAAMLPIHTLNEPNTSKILNPTHHENSPLEATCALPCHQVENSNLAANEPSLLGPPPSSSTNKQVPTQNAWNRRPKLQMLPKVPCLAEISKDGSSVSMDEEASCANVERLSCALVGKTIGRPLPFQLLKSELKRNWDSYGEFKLSILSFDTFICMFDSPEIRDSIILGGPWFASNQLLALDCWTENFDPKLLGGFSSPTWIRLPQLPLHYWDKVNLSRIGAMLGDPLFVDETTMTWSRTEFARICVRLDFSKKIPKGIWIEGKHRRFFQPIFYEGLPKIYFSCGHIGHAENNCPLPKTPPPDTFASPPTTSPAAIEVPPPMVDPPPTTYPPYIEFSPTFSQYSP